MMRLQTDMPTVSAKGYRRELGHAPSAFLLCEIQNIVAWRFRYEFAR